jgi:FkbM family methyltransferase
MNLTHCFRPLRRLKAVGDRIYFNTRKQMKNYSQNAEQEAIIDFFRGSLVGNFLDIGAYHPTNLSNTRCLREMGWGGVFVEPNPALIPAFEEAYGDNASIQLLPVCVGAENKEVEFLVASGGDIMWGDAVSTLDPAWTPRWEKAGVKFEPIKRDLVTVPELLKRCQYDKFEFISIDTEGNVLEILDQINPRELGTRLMCVEWNRQDFDNFDAYFKRYKFREYYRSAENLIYGEE